MFQPNVNLGIEFLNLGFLLPAVIQNSIRSPSVERLLPCGHNILCV